MEDDFREFAKQFSNEQNISDTFQENVAYDEAKNIFDKYKSYSQGDLLGEISKLIMQQKQNGTFNKAELLSKMNMFSSFIPAQKINELKELIDKIDSQN